MFQKLRIQNLAFARKFSYFFWAKFKILFFKHQKFQTAVSWIVLKIQIVEINSIKK